MAAFAGIASFVIALILSYQIFPDPGTGDMGYAGGRFIFTAAVTTIVSVVATRVSKSHREAEQKSVAPIGESEADQEQDTNVADERAWILRQYSSIDSAVAGQRAFASLSLFSETAASA